MWDIASDVHTELPKGSLQYVIDGGGTTYVSIYNADMSNMSISIMTRRQLCLMATKMGHQQNICLTKDTLHEVLSRQSTLILI